MLGLLISSILLKMCSSQCDAPWCYENAYMTVCHDEEECGLVSDKTTGSGCEWVQNPANGVAVRPGMFESYCDKCKNNDGVPLFLCSYELGFDEVGHSGSGSAYICAGDGDDQKQTCYVNCGAELCIRRTDSDTGKIFYKTARMVSSCPEHHPVNTKQCCAGTDGEPDWAHCTCLQRPTVDVSDDVYDDLGQSNGFIDVWYGACSDSDEYHATDDGSIKLVNQDNISGYYYGIHVHAYNPNIVVTTVKAKSANVDYYYDCARQCSEASDGDCYNVWICNNLKNAAPGNYMEGPISIELYQYGFTDNGVTPYIKQENIMTLTSGEIQLIDLRLDYNGLSPGSFTEGSSTDSSSKQTIFIIAGLLIAIAFIVILGFVGYCIYKKAKQNKGDVSFNHDDGVENTAVHA